MSNPLIRQQEFSAESAEPTVLGSAARRMMKASVGERSCPTCGMLFHPVMSGGDCVIAWDDARRRFTVEATVADICPGCGTSAADRQRLTLASVPLEIAQTSSCACGATLALQDYTLRIEGSDLRFTAVYRCDACSKQREAAERSVGSRLAALWKRTKKVKLGPDGVEYEKEATP